MVCSVCMALEYGSAESLRRLVQWQAIQLDRLTGGMYEEPDFDLWDELAPDEPERPSVDVLAVVESVLGYDDIWRKPPRAAAPRLVEHLATAGLTITTEDA